MTQTIMWQLFAGASGVFMFLAVCAVMFNDMKDADMTVRIAALLITSALFSIAAAIAK